MSRGIASFLRARPTLGRLAWSIRTDLSWEKVSSKFASKNISRRKIRTGDDRDAGPCRSTGRTETSNRPKIWVGAGGIDVLEDVKAKVLAQPVRVDVFGALVDGERYRPYNRDACQGCRYT